jgi:hypothetical protein
MHFQINYDNQTMIVNVNSLKDNMKSSRHVKTWLKPVRKMRNSGVIALDNVQTAKIWQILLLKVFH